MKIVDAVVNEEGSVRLLEPVALAAGQRLIVTILEKPEAVLSLADLEGCIPYSGRPITIEEMNQAVAEGASGR